MTSTLREIAVKLRILEQEVRSSNKAFEERLNSLHEELMQAIINQEEDLKSGRVLEIAEEIGEEGRDDEEGLGEGEIPIQSCWRRALNSILGYWRRAWSSILSRCKAVAKWGNNLLSPVATYLIATYQKYKILMKLVEFAAGVFALTLYIKNSV